MAKLVRRTWDSDPSSGLSRRDRRSCDYEAYVPDQLATRAFTLEGDVAAEAADAEVLIGGGEDPGCVIEAGRGSRGRHRQRVMPSGRRGGGDAGTPPDG